MGVLFQTCQQHAAAAAVEPRFSRHDVFQLLPLPPQKIYIQLRACVRYLKGLNIVTREAVFVADARLRIGYCTPNLYVVNGSHRDFTSKQKRRHNAMLLCLPFASAAVRNIFIFKTSSPLP